MGWEGFGHKSVEVVSFFISQFFVGSDIHLFSVWWFGASAPVISFCFCMS